MSGASASFITSGLGGLSVSVTPEAGVSGYGNTGASANITTALALATATGGVGSITYAWTQVTSSPYTWVINTPSASSTSFTCNTLGEGTTAEATFKVTATDSVGNTATDTIDAFANNGQPYDSRDRSAIGDTR